MTYCSNPFVLRGLALALNVSGQLWIATSEEFPEAKMRREYDWVKNPKARPRKLPSRGYGLRLLVVDR